MLYTKHLFKYYIRDLINSAILNDNLLLPVTVYKRLIYVLQYYILQYIFCQEKSVFEKTLFLWPHDRDISEKHGYA